MVILWPDYTPNDTVLYLFSSKQQDVSCLGTFHQLLAWYAADFPKVNRCLQHEVVCPGQLGGGQHLSITHLHVYDRDPSRQRALGQGFECKVLHLTTNDCNCDLKSFLVEYLEPRFNFWKVYHSFLCGQLLVYKVAKFLAVNDDVLALPSWGEVSHAMLFLFEPTMNRFVLVDLKLICKRCLGMWCCGSIFLNRQEFFVSFADYLALWAYVVLDFFFNVCHMGIWYQLTC